MRKKLLSSTFSATFEQMLWTASVAFPSWTGALSFLYAALLGGVSLLTLRRLCDTVSRWPV